MKSGSALTAMLEAKYPRFYAVNLCKYTHWKQHKITANHQHYLHCSLRFEQEPGFFFRAMDVSHAFSVAVLLGTGFVLFFGFSETPFLVYILVLPK